MDLEEARVSQLKVEELEAMRLKDILNLSQEEAAKQMQVSRQTFQNIIDSARNKVAKALVDGEAIRIGGGHYKIYDCKIECKHCHTLYDLEIVADKNKCPVCGSSQVYCQTKGHKCLGECMEN